MSAFAYATHVWNERTRLGSSPRALASHVATVWGSARSRWHSRSLAAQRALRPTWLLALVLFPAFTAVSAFLVALGAAAVLDARRERGNAPS
ncbi:MAG TPA: hypothetical protein VJT85_00920 [Gemmatimonadaceae bacterium]|nr:hypothetical protein [Gemmatimonadaceae bacterium]